MRLAIYPPDWSNRESSLGTLFSAFGIARSGLQAAQVQLDIAGHNIANVNKEGFSRQRVELLSNTPLEKTFGNIGRGVRVATIIRIREAFLDAVYRDQVGGLKSAEIQAEFYTQIEDVFQEPGPNGISGRINDFFDALHEFSNNVEEAPVRQSVINSSEALVAMFRETSDRLTSLRTNANEEVLNFVPEINALAERISDLNELISKSELTGKPANDLRDDRDLQIDRLAEVVNIFTRERDDGRIEILVSGAELVSATTFRALEAIRVPALDPERNDLVEVRFVDTGEPLVALDGELAGALKMRDQAIVEVDARVDIIAATIIEQINRIHSNGNGTRDYSTTISSTNAVTSGAVATSAAGLPFALATGSFDLIQYDAAGAIVSTVTVAYTDGVTTLNDIAAAVGGTVTAGGFLEVSPTVSSFAFANDTTGLLAALGIGTLFTGTDARTMGLNQDIVNTPSLLASAFSIDPLDTGDNRAALAMADIRDGLFLDSGDASINDFYESTIVGIGVNARSNLENAEIERSFVESFQRRRQEVSGVSLDEEVTFLLQFQRAFEASARVVTVTDRMLDSLLAMAR
jgi:flagellar hook-associated protein 1 FlgK